MFELIAIRRSVNAGGQFDAGLLAEALFFYGQVHLILDGRALAQLCQEVGIENLLRLLNSGHARATYIRNSPVVYTQGRGVELHFFLQGRSGEGRGGQQFSAEDEIRGLLLRQGSALKEATKHAREFLSLVPQSRLDDGSSKAPDFPSRLVEEVRVNPNFLAQAQIVLDGFLPGQASRHMTRFHLQEVERASFRVDTDLNWSAVRGDFARLSGSQDSPLTEARILERILDGYVDLGLAARFGCELLTSETAERLIAQQVQQIVQRRARSEEEIAIFNQRILGDSYAIREAINSKVRSFTDFLDILDKAQRIKSMIQKTNPDVGLLGAYVKEVGKDSWLDRLAPKTARFGVFTVAGLVLEAVAPLGVGTVLGISTSAFDHFVVDKLAKGWRPNTFIDKTLQPFVDGK